MHTFAVYNLKGGVGKTAAAVNLAFLAARDGLRTLLWDLDPQGAASWYFRVDPHVDGGAGRLIGHKKELAHAVKTTDHARLDIVPADFSYRNLDLELLDTKKPHKRLRRMLEPLAGDYDLVLLDCAPSISLASESVFHAADALLVPIIPTHLSLRAYDQVAQFVRSQQDLALDLMPFFSMVDRRRLLHKELVTAFAAGHAELLRSFIPYASEVERMGSHRAPLGAYAPACAPARAFEALWAAIRTRRPDLPPAAAGDA
ncbi:MAG: ParA family protein [Gammaproteobacteria bacterium]